MVDLIWDIQAEHLDEGEFLLEMWTHCSDSPSFTLSTLADGPEERLLAHIDGLVIGGPRVVEALLLPVIAGPEQLYRSAVAIWAVLQGGSLDACAQVLARLDRAGEAGAGGLALGLIHARRAGLIDWLGRDIDRRRGRGLAVCLRVLAARRVDAGARLGTWLRADALAVRQAAATLARHTKDPEQLRLLHPLMGETDDDLRWAAIESGLIRWLPGAWERACAEAFGASSPAHRRAALAWIALLGDDGAHRRLLAELAAAPSPALLWAASLCGRPGAVDSALELLEHPTLARLAGEVVCAIAGLPSDDRRLWLDRGARIGEDELEALPAFEDDALDGDLTPSGDDALPLPNPDEVRSWWIQRRPGLAPGLRHLAGRPLDTATLAHALRTAPTRRRHPLALELAARTDGRAQLDTRALSFAQQAHMRTIFPELGPLDLQRGLALPT